MGFATERAPRVIVRATKQVMAATVNTTRAARNKMAEAMAITIWRERFDGGSLALRALRRAGCVENWRALLWDRRSGECRLF